MSSAFSVIPSFQNPFQSLSKGFDFGSGGMFNGFNIPSVASGMQNQTQGQASGGFNTPYSFGTNSSSIPGFGGGNDSFNFTANGTQNLNPFSLFGFPSSGTSGIPGGNSSFLPPVAGKDLKDIYGKGIGNALAQFLSSGAGFNPGVIQAQMNAAMPIEARGVESIMNAMGAHGLSNSSTAALGVGDFESQFNAQLMNMFAQEYEQSVQNYLKVLTGVQSDAKDSHAQSSSPLSILSSIFTTGSSIPFSFL